MAEVSKLVDSYQQTVQNLESENAQLKEENTALERRSKDADSRCASVGQENVLVKSEVENLRDLLKKSEDERDKLRKKVADITKLNRIGNEDKDNEIERLQEKVASMGKVIMKSGQETRDLTDKIPVLLEDKEELRQEIERLTTLMRKQDQDMETMRQQVTNAERQLEESLVERNKFAEQLKEAQEKEYSDERLQKIESLEKENKLLISEIENTKADLKSLEKRMAHKDEEVKLLREELANQLESLERATLDVSKHKEESRRLREENKALEKEVEDLREQVRNTMDSNVELSILKDQKRRVEEDCAAMRKKNDILTERLGTMEETTKSLVLMIKEKQRHNDEFISEIEKLKTQNKILSREVNEKMVPNKRKKNTEEPTLVPPSRAEKLDEDDLKSSHKRLLEENRRFRTILTMKSMTEQNAITQMAELEQLIDSKTFELEQSLAKQKRLEDWLNEILINKKYQLILNDEIDNFKNLPSPHLPSIPDNFSLVSPHQTPRSVGGTRKGSSPSATVASKCRTTGTRPRGRLIGSYNKKKHATEK